jgi:hypothetical protein
MAIASYGQCHDALVGPQSSRNRGRDEQQHDEYILELRQKPAPRGGRSFGDEFVAPVLP